MTEILIDADDFEHLLNCMANQKFLPTIPWKKKSEDEVERQNIIDRAWRKGMNKLSKTKRAG